MQREQTALVWVQSIRYLCYLYAALVKCDGPWSESFVDGSNLPLKNEFTNARRLCETKVDLHG